MEGAGIGFIVGLAVPAIIARELGFDWNVAPLITGIIGAVIGGIIGSGMQGNEGE